jgi:predicted RNase H-like nuclease (RuvC/YqgF family)
MSIDTDSIIDAVNEALKEHMENQPYSIKYSDDSDVDYESEVDSDGDLILTIQLPNRIQELEDELEQAREEIEGLEKEVRGLQEEVECLERALRD